MRGIVTGCRVVPTPLQKPPQHPVERYVWYIDTSVTQGRAVSHEPKRLNRHTPQPTYMRNRYDSRVHHHHQHHHHHYNHCHAPTPEDGRNSNADSNLLVKDSYVRSGSISVPQGELQPAGGLRFDSVLIFGHICVPRARKDGLAPDSRWCEETDIDRSNDLNHGKRLECRPTKLSLKGIHEAGGVVKSQGHNLHIVLLEKARENGWHQIPGWWRVFLGEATERPVLLRTLANMARVCEVHPVLVLYMTSDKTRLYKFVDGLLRFATQSPDAAWYRALPPALPTQTPLDVNVQWILPPGAPGAAVAGPQAANFTTTISTPSRTPPLPDPHNERDPERASGQGGQRRTGHQARRSARHHQGKPQSDSTAMTIWCPKRKFDTIDGTLKALETRLGNVKDSLKPEVLEDFIKKNLNPYPGFVTTDTKCQDYEQVAKRRRVEAFFRHTHQT
ncbi:hypothetical protein FN846DRAFT_894832 [Sphaerosporella brunnea]|uniref:Uncharacterized protein n=1 Tax=Sphaerosporella brunnea TaxID=1250544 RepID=A0A5J5EHJ6_9PEZI|nr:hypothetical protein FN846DRAFT_894832 [Sphaerosporella brunnea]